MDMQNQNAQTSTSTTLASAATLATAATLTSAATLATAATLTSAATSASSATSPSESVSPPVSLTGPSATVALGSAPTSHIQDPNDNHIPALDKRRLQELVDEIDPDERLDEDVEDSLLEIADDFIENVTTSACRLALHRKSTSLSVDDIQMVLEKNFKIHIPGFGKPLMSDSSTSKKSYAAEAHRQRMALIKRTMKKMNG